MFCFKKIKNNGQAVSIDIVIAVALFLIAIAISISIWQNSNETAEKQLVLQDMQANAARTIDFLVRSPGETIYGDGNWEDCSIIPCPVPYDWNSHLQAKVKFIGLATRDRVVSKAKLTKFVEFVKDHQLTLSPPNTNSDYNRVKARMLLNYDYYFKLLDRHGNTVEEPLGAKMEAGDIVPGSPFASIILKRIVNYEGTNYNGEAIVELTVFRKN